MDGREVGKRNWNPVIIKDPIPKIKPTKIKDYDIEGIPGLPGPKSSRKGKRPKKGRKTENTSEVDLIFGSEKPKRTKTTPRPLTKYQKYKLTQKSLPENIAKLQAERDRRAKLNSLTPEQKVEHFAHNKFIDKKASQFFKKHGRPPTSVDKEK
ncbi:33747_t:CDS:2 [Gigaspora margarita]|uniref:33747_t:CDS:1 n=1 Tax=Gigaspora margarita TaxID=4874 RepID=A0ABN7X8W1_GIGMA|nr:33747_t:CDS:2 [Gigaspora margarita]